MTIVKYTLDGTTGGGEADVDELESEYNCNQCGDNITEVPCQLLREDAYGNYFCENDECVWAMVSDCYSVEISGVITEGEEE